MATIEGKRLVTVSVTKALASAAGYTAEDVLCENATTGTPYTFATIAKVNGGTGYIVKAQAICETTAVTPRLTLYLFNATPTSQLINNIFSNWLIFFTISIYCSDTLSPILPLSKKELLKVTHQFIATPFLRNACIIWGISF